MRIGLIDVDGHNFPNLALMRISAWHKAQGDTVEWWQGDLIHYNEIYKSKIFSDAYTKDIPDPMNCDVLHKGGTGYAITLNGGGIEEYDKAKDDVLPAEIETMKPDYSIYPEYKFAVCMTSRGCPRNCSFCHVSKKEGRNSVKVANVEDFYEGQSLIHCLDPNITACKDKHELFQQYTETGAEIIFNQGLDIRLITEQDIDDLNHMKVKTLHFSWDKPEDNLEEKFVTFSKLYMPNRKTWHGNKGIVNVLVNFNSTMEENLHRIYTLRDLQFEPYIMIYDKPHCSKELMKLQRWVNNKFIFRKCQTFEEYDTRIG